MTELSKNFKDLELSFVRTEWNERAAEENFCVQAVYKITFYLYSDNYFYRPHDKKTYLTVGSMKTLLLNVSLLNAGDDAYETVLHIQIPKGLYFIRVLELVRTKKKNLSNSNLGYFSFSARHFSNYVNGLLSFCRYWQPPALPPHRKKKVDKMPVFKFSDF